MPIIHWDLTVNLNTLLTLPMLLMIAKMYGDWRIIKDRIDLMWFDYCVTHNINPKAMVDLRGTK